ncbi:cold-shock protein [Sphingomicrobium sediminis]|uniref:Cold-shock protein n=1 Tax=Sphingomicrobium sediminis TaxID=2950949 RepID=A0A9X2J276_9SPHN|nr:cold-shock protein [Sphingomicrobium sediminis]MCM8557993.1 cold-shock protein [Sphingomicrobium sediminis]
MTDIGKIHSYDCDKGIGMISPVKGGEALPFVKAELRDQLHDPKAEDRYSYETGTAENGDIRAVKLWRANDRSPQNPHRGH